MKGELQSLWFAEDQAWDAYKPKVVHLGKETGVELRREDLSVSHWAMLKKSSSLPPNNGLDGA